MIRIEHICDRCGAAQTMENPVDAPTGWAFVTFMARNNKREVVAGSDETKIEVCSSCLPKELKDSVNLIADAYLLRSTQETDRVVYSRIELSTHK